MLSMLSVFPQVSVIKAKLHELLSMPVGKQKLQFEVTETNASMFPSCLLFASHMTAWCRLLAGNVHQRLQLAGLLQHDEEQHGAAADEGERRSQEVTSRQRILHFTRADDHRYTTFS